MSAVDIAARGLAARLQRRMPGRKLADLKATRLDPMGSVSSCDRGEYEPVATAPTATETLRGYGFTDAGGKHWAQPLNRECHLYRDGGIAGHTGFNAAGVPTGTVTGQSDAIQDLLYRMANRGGGVLKANDLRGALMLDKSVIVPLGVSFDLAAGVTSMAAQSTVPPYANAPLWQDTFRVMPTGAGQFYKEDGTLTPIGDASKGFLFWLNIDPSVNPNTWIKSFPNRVSGHFRNIYVDGQSASFASLFRGAGSYVIEDIRGRSVNQVFSKPAIYVDGLSLRRIHCQDRANNTDYLIDLPGLGDALKVEDIACGYKTSGGTDVTSRGVQVGLCRGGEVSGLINGIHEFKTGDAVRITDCHFEGGGLILDQFDGLVENNHFQSGKNAPCVPIVVKNSSSAQGHSCRVVLRDNLFFHYGNGGGGETTGWASQEQLDISIESNRTQVVVGTGNRRVAGVSGAISRRVYMAPVIGDNTQAAGSKTFANWKNYAPMLCDEGCTITNRTVRVNGSQKNHQSPWTNLQISTTTNTAPMVWLGATGPRFYKARPLYDPVRLIGRTPSGTAEVSETLTNGSTTLPVLTFTGAESTTGAIMWEVLSGPASGSYDKRVLLPAMEMNYMIDNGEAINGFPWETFGPGAEATLNNGGHCGTMVYEEGILTIKDTITAGNPSAGTWTVGDRLDRPSAAPDGNNMKAMSRVCRTAGTIGAGATFDPLFHSTVSPAT